MREKQGLNILNHRVYSLHHRLVLVKKYRRRCITAPTRERLRLIFKDLCDKWKCELLEFSGNPDHVHRLVALQPKVAPSVFVSNVKTAASRLIRKEFASEVNRWYRKPVFWSQSYGTISVGGGPLSVLTHYIEQQVGAE